MSEALKINLDLDEEIVFHLCNPESWAEFRAETFSPELIEDNFVRKIYEWQDNHFKDYGVIATEAAISDEWDIGFLEPQTVVGDLLEKLRERYANNHSRKLLEGGAEVYKNNPLEVPEYFTREGRALKQLLDHSGEVFRADEAQRALDQYQLKVNRGKGAGLGFEELNHYFHGQHGLTFFVGAPKAMKSWMMINCAVGNVREGRNTWLYSLELPAEESDARLRCMIAEVPWWKYLKNEITRGEEQRIKEASEKLADEGLYSIIKPPPGERDIDSLIGKARDAGAEIVLADQLQYIEVNKRSLGELNEPGAYWGALYRARDLSDEGPICFAHQFNRSAMYSDEMPDIRQAKGSSAIEETATLALGLWSNKDMRRSNVLELGTLISRNYMFEAWEVGVDLSNRCNFDILGVVRVEDEE